MKRIKHREDIEREKLRLRVLQLEQEKALHQSWAGLKHDLQPGTLLRNKLSEMTHSKAGEGHWVSGLLHFGSGYLGHVAGRNIENTLNKGIEVMAEKIEDITNKLKPKTRR